MLKKLALKGVNIRLDLRLQSEQDSLEFAEKWTINAEKDLLGDDRDAFENPVGADAKWSDRFEYRMSQVPMSD